MSQTPEILQSQISSHDQFKLSHMWAAPTKWHISRLLGPGIIGKTKVVGHVEQNDFLSESESADS